MLPCLNNQSEEMVNIIDVIESSEVPLVFKNMIDDWKPLKWNLEDWNSICMQHPLSCRKGKITCTKEPLWEHKCINGTYSFSQLDETSQTIETHGDWLYFDYKYIGQQIDASLFDNISWEKFGQNLAANDSTLWIGSAGAHTPCHQDLYGFNLVAQVYGKKRWILMPPDMGKYLEPTRIPYEESSRYSKINFSCPENIKKIDKNCKCVSVVLSPGDVLLVPHKWWHYVENITTAVSINAWIQDPKYDNLARLSESVVRYMASNVCSILGDEMQSLLLNPNETYTSNMTTESVDLIHKTLQVIERENDTSTKMPTKLDPISLPKCQYKTLQADQSLCTGQFETVYHKKHHSIGQSSNDTNNIDFSFRLMDAICSENVVNEIVNNLIKKD